jgi:hypothetical protein
MIRRLFCGFSPLKNDRIWPLPIENVTVATRNNIPTSTAMVLSDFMVFSFISQIFYTSRKNEDSQWRNIFINDAAANGLRYPQVGGRGLGLRRV